MTTLRLGSRRSALAQAQANAVAHRLRALDRALRVDVILMATAGDRSTTPLLPPPPGGLKTLFTKEIEAALLEKRIDLAVHSMKDVASELPPGLIMGAVPEREDPRDVWISKNNKPLISLTAGARIGTGAVRRQAQLRHANPALEIVPLRGNVDSRLARLQAGDFDGIVIAWAGLARLGRETEATEILPIDRMLPAVGQGCLCLQIRADDRAVQALVARLDHPLSRQAALTERAFLAKLGGDCHSPIAAYARLEKGVWHIDGLVASLDGTTLLRDRLEYAGTDPEPRGRQLAAKLLAAGADRLLKNE